MSNLNKIINELQGDHYRALERVKRIRYLPEDLKMECMSKVYNNSENPKEGYEIDLRTLADAYLLQLVYREEYHRLKLENQNLLELLRLSWLDSSDEGGNAELKKLVENKLKGQ